MLYWIIEEIFRMEEEIMEKLEVSYIYDPERKRLSCDVMCGGLGDSFCAMFDDHPTHKTIHDLVDGFVQRLQEKEERRMGYEEI